MSRVRGGYGMRLALALLLVAANSSAQVRDRALITLTAAASQSVELRNVLTELLERDEIEVRFSLQAHFGSGELLRASSSGEGVEAFVVPDSAGRARLYFRAPDGQRFLVRDVVLPSGLDAVGRELIAQIVDASVVALLHSEVGISRAQVKAEVDSVSVNAGETEPAPSAAQPSSPPKPTPDSKAEASSTVRAGGPRPTPSAAQPRSPPKPGPTREHTPLVAEGWLGLQYSADLSGSALGVQHGPGLELGVGLRGRAFIRTRLLLERDFPVTLQAGPIDARVATERWRTLVDGGVPWGRNRAFALSIGAGQDSSRIEPTASRSDSVLPAGSSRKSPFVLHSEARMEAGLSAFELVLALGVDIPLVRTPYDVDRGSAAKQQAVPWAVRPAAALSFAWRPQLGAF